MTTAKGLNCIHMWISVAGKVNLTGSCSRLCPCPWLIMLWVAHDFPKYSMEVPLWIKLDILQGTLHGYGRSDIFGLEITDHLADAQNEADWHSVCLLDTNSTSIDLMAMCVSCLGTSSSPNRWYAITTRPSSRNSSPYSCDSASAASFYFHHVGDLHLRHSLDIHGMLAPYWAVHT